MRRARPTLPWVLGTGLLLALVPNTVRGVEEGGVISGSVRFVGTPPPAKQMPVDKDKDVCGTGSRELVDVNVAEDGSLRNIVVCVQGNGEEPRFEPPEGGFKLDQKNCRFVPEIFIVPAGEKLRITNRDPIIHNIHTYEIITGVRRDLFNFAQPERGHRRTETIKPRRSNTVELACDIHSFMHGWIFVSDGSACVVSPNGRFKISHVPEGTQTVRVWHPTLGEQETEVTLTGAREVTVDFEFSAAD